MSVAALDNTDHNRKGSGILAARRDIEMDDGRDIRRGMQAFARGDLNTVRRLLLNPNNGITVNFPDYDRRTDYTWLPPRVINPW
jgi:hypothetical protein